MSPPLLRRTIPRHHQPILTPQQRSPIIYRVASKTSHQYQAQPPAKMTSIFEPSPSSSDADPFSQVLLNLPTTDVATIADQLTTLVTTSPKPDTALWQLWDTLINTVITTSTLSDLPQPYYNQGPKPNHTRIFALLDAIRSQPPQKPKYIPSSFRRHLHPEDGKLHWSSPDFLPGFYLHCRDVHDILESRRDSLVPTKGGISPGECYLRFCQFLAGLMKRERDSGGNHILVFYACRMGMERRGLFPSSPAESAGTSEGSLSPRETWRLDIRAAATWLRDAGEVLWAKWMHRDDDGGEGLRRHYADALDDGTEMWEGGKGLTRDRWAFWARRLREIGGDDDSGLDDEETRGVALEAARVVERLLERGES